MRGRDDDAVEDGALILRAPGRAACGCSGCDAIYGDRGGDWISSVVELKRPEYPVTQTKA